MVDVITNTMPKNVSSKLSAEEDYEQNKESGNFVYQGNKKRSEEEKNVNVEMPKPRPQPPTVDDTVDDKSIPVPQPDDTEGDKSITPPSVDDTKGVTKPIIRKIKDTVRPSQGMIVGFEPSLPGLVNKVDGAKAGLDNEKLASRAKKDLLLQESGISEAELINDVNNGNAIAELDNDELGKLEYAIDILNEPTSTSDEKKTAQNILDSSIDIVNSTRGQEGVKVGFSRGENLEFQPSKEALDAAKFGNFSLLANEENYSNSRKEFFKIVKGQFDEKLGDDAPTIEQILMDTITTGEFWDTTAEVLNEDLRALGITLPPMIFNLVRHGTVALAKGLNPFSDSEKDISEYWAESQSDREQNAASWKQALENNPTPAKLRALSVVINENIHNALKKQLDENKIDQATYDRLTKSDIMGKDGKPLKKMIVSEDQAQSFLLESIEQLHGSLRFLMIAAQNVPMIQGLAKKQTVLASRNMKNMKKKVSKLEAEQIALGNNKYDGMSLLEKANRMELDGLDIKVNHQVLGMAMREENVATSFGRMVDRRDRLATMLVNMDRKNVSPKSLKYIAIKKEYESVKGKVFRNYWSGRTKPIFREALLLSMPASIMQWASTEAFRAADSGVDQFTAQGIGALFHMVTAFRFGKNKQTGGGGMSIQDGVYNVIKYPFAQAGEATSAFMDVMAMSRIPGVSILRSKDLEEYNTLVKQARNGVGLSLKERRGAKYIFDLAAHLPKETLDKLLVNVKSQVKLEEDIIAQFPVGERDEIRQLVAAPFAQATGLTWLKSAYALSGTNIGAKDFKNFNKLQELQDISDAQMRQLEFTERSIQNLRNKLINRTDIENPAAVEKLVNRYEKMYDAQKDSVIENNYQLFDDYEEMNRKMFIDPDVNITNEIADQMLNTGVKARMRLNPLLTEGEALEQQINANYKLLEQRARVVNSNLNSPKHPARAASLMEEVFDLHIESMYAKGKLAYVKLDKMALSEKKTVDVSDLIYNFKELADPLKETDFAAFFSKDGMFFNSTLNKKLRVSLNKMAERSLAGLNNNTVKKLREMATTEGSEHFIGKNVDDVDIALYYQEIGELKAFKAAPSEVADVYTAFRDYAVRMGDSQPALASKFEQQAGTIKQLIRKFDDKYYNMWEEANSTYKANVFDKLAGSGPLSDFVASKDNRILELTKKGTQSGPYKGIYKEGREPDKLFNRVIDSVNKYMKSGKEEDLSTVQNYMANFNRQLTDLVGDENVFDLTTPQGMAKYEAFEGALSAMIYSKWARPTLDRINKLDPRSQKLLNQSNGGYDFTAFDQDRLHDITRATTVKIKTADGIKEVPIINFTKIITDEKDIVKVMADSAKLQEKFQTFRTVSNGKIKNIKATEAAKLKLRDKTIEDLGVLTGQTPIGFYDKFIVNGSVDNLTILRGQAMEKGMKKEDFNNAVLYLATNGLFARGGQRIIPGQTITDFDGIKKPIRGFDNPQNITKDLRTDNITQIFEEFLGVDHTRYLDDISDLLAKEKAASMNVDKINGILRPMGDNEIISRAFNLARGMVSPTYVGAEIALRIASGAGVDMVRMAAGSKEASRLMAKMLKYPEKLNKVELGRMSILIQDFLITELANMGKTIPDYYFKVFPEEEETT